jgi:hypothetical protein
MDDPGFEVRFPARDFSFLLKVETASGVCPNSYTKGTWAPGPEADRCPPSSAEVNSNGNIYVYINFSVRLHSVTLK